MKRNKKLLLAWTAFFIIIALFVIIVDICHRNKKSHGFSYQYRILINKDLIVESNEDTPTHEEEIGNVDSDDDFYEHTKYGYLPKISPNGIRVFEKYRVNYTAVSKKRLGLAVLISDNKIELLKKLGNQKITLIIPHYLDNLDEIVKNIREGGHEFFIQMPTQASIPIDKKEAISPFLANASLEDTVDKLFFLLASTKYAIGTANTTSTLFTKSTRDIVAITDELSKRGIAFFDIEESNNLLKDISEKNSLIYIHATHVFDTNFDISKLKDSDILMVDLKLLGNFIKLIPNDWELVPVSALIKE